MPPRLQGKETLVTRANQKKRDEVLATRRLSKVLGQEIRGESERSMYSAVARSGSISMANKFFRPRYEAQQHFLALARQDFPNVELKTMELFPTELKGLASFRTSARRLFGVSSQSFLPESTGNATGLFGRDERAFSPSLFVAGAFGGKGCSVVAFFVGTGPASFGVSGLPGWLRRHLRGKRRR